MSHIYALFIIQFIEIKVQKKDNKVKKTFLEGMKYI